MNFYIIPPIANIELMHEGNSYFCLAQHFLNNEMYRNFFKSLGNGAWVTLDCGVGDYEPVTNESLLEVAKELRPSEVIPLDVLWDKKQTIENVDWMVAKLKELKLMSRTAPSRAVQIFGVPQGKTKEEWLECYKSLLDNSGVSTIGLSKISCPKLFVGKENDEGIMEGRHACFDILKKQGWLKKPLHMLGMGNPKEFGYYQNPIVRSTDSCNTCWAAMNGISFMNGDFRRVPTPRDYFQRTMTDREIILAKSNIGWMQTALGKL